MAMLYFAVILLFLSGISVSSSCDDKGLEDKLNTLVTQMAAMETKINKLETKLQEQQVKVLIFDSVNSASRNNTLQFISIPILYVQKSF